MNDSVMYRSSVSWKGGEGRGYSVSGVFVVGVVSTRNHGFARQT